MPKTCPYPENLNPLSPNGFTLAIDKLPDLTFFSQNVGLPGLSLGSANASSSLVDYGVAGDKIEFEPLTVEFLVDEGMKNYNAIADWMISLGFPESHEQYKQFLSEAKEKYELSASTADGIVSILGSNNTAVAEYQFADLYPISLSNLGMTSTANDVDYVVATVEFRYTFMKRK